MCSARVLCIVISRWCCCRESHQQKIKKSNCCPDSQKKKKRKKKWLFVESLLGSRYICQLYTPLDCSIYTAWGLKTVLRAYWISTEIISRFMLQQVLLKSSIWEEYSLQQFHSACIPEAHCLSKSLPSTPNAPKITSHTCLPVRHICSELMLEPVLSIQFKFFLSKGISVQTFTVHVHTCQTKGCPK